MFPGAFGGMGTLSSEFDDWAKGFTTTAGEGIGKIKSALGGDLTKAALAGAIEAFRPIAAKSLGKTEANTSDEEVLAYLSTVGTAGISARMAEVAKEKANTAILVVGGGLALIAAAMYFGRQKRGLE